VGTTWLSLSTSAFAIVNASLVVLWLGVAWRIGRNYQSLSITGRPPDFSPVGVSPETSVQIANEV
jgi:hypothetical protein